MDNLTQSAIDIASLVHKGELLIPNNINESMTDKEILEQAIQKAIDGGFTQSKYFYIGIPPKVSVWMGGEGKLSVSQAFSSVPSSLRVVFNSGISIHEYPIEALIFDHDFAKCLWGDYNTDYLLYYQFTAIEPHLLAWQYHLQQMVIAEDPIKYLGENI